MTKAALWRIVWKETKQLRAIALAFFVVASLSLLLMSSLLTTVDSNGRLEYVASLWICLFGVLCGSILFASEKEHGTFGNLQFMPISWPTVFTGKLATGIGFVVLPLILFALLSLIIKWTWSPPIVVNEVVMDDNVFTWPGQIPWGTLFSGALLYFSFGLLFSLFCNRVLTAAVLAIATAAVCDFLFLLPFGLEHRDFFALELYSNSIALRLGCAFLVLLLTIPLSRHWWQGSSLSIRRVVLKVDGRAGDSNRLASAMASRLTILMRLFWQTVHENYRALLAMSAAVLVGSIFITIIVAISQSTYVSMKWVLYSFPVVLVCWLAGVLSFATDQRQSSYQFFVQHREYPRLLWLTRNGCWISALSLLVALGVAILTVGSADEIAFSGNMLIPILLGFESYQLLFSALHERDVLALLQNYNAFYLMAAVVVFGIGQLVSILFRSSIVAGFVAFIASAIALLWVFLAMLLMAPWWWSVLPLALATLFASWWWSPRWMVDANSWIGRGVSLAIVLTSLSVVIVGTNIYRQFYIPGHRVAWSWNEAPADIFQEARRRYTSALSALDTRTMPSNYWIDDLFTDGLEASAEIRTQLEAWTTQNEDVISRLGNAANYISQQWAAVEGVQPWLGGELQPSNRMPLPPFDMPVGLGSSMHLLTAQAAVGIWNGDRQSTWSALETKLKIQQQQYEFFPYYTDLFTRETPRTLTQIDRWLDMPGHTQAELQHALSTIDRTKVDYWNNLRRLVFDFSRAQHLRLDEKNNTGDMRESFDRLATLLVPAVRQNRHALIEHMTQLQLDIIDSYEDKQQDGVQARLSDQFYRMSGDISGNSRRRLNQLARWEMTTVLTSENDQLYSLNHLEIMMKRHLDFERLRRTLMLKTALIIHKLRHENYPSSLDELTSGGILERLPIDPISQAHFLYLPRGLSHPVYDRAGYRDYFVQILPAHRSLLFGSAVSDLGVKSIEAIERRVLPGDEQFNPNDLNPRPAKGFTRLTSQTDFTSRRSKILLLPE